MRLVFRQEDMRRRERERGEMVGAGGRAGEMPSDTTALRRNAIGFVGATLALVAAAPVLAASAKELAALTGISTTFIGTSMVAITTSLPEMVTALAAARLGAYDLAVGNLFGSNAFNMAAVVFADAAYQAGPLLSAVSETHTVTALVSIVLMTVGLMGIIYRAERRFFLIEPDSLLMILGYGLAIGLLYRLG
jgi:cation:H+ antiporter